MLCVLDLRALMLALIRIFYKERESQISLLSAQTLLLRVIISLRLPTMEDMVEMPVSWHIIAVILSITQVNWTLTAQIDSILREKFRNWDLRRRMLEDSKASCQPRDGLLFNSSSINSRNSTSSTIALLGILEAMVAGKIVKEALASKNRLLLQPKAALIALHRLDTWEVITKWW